MIGEWRRNWHVVFVLLLFAIQLAVRLSIRLVGSLVEIIRWQLFRSDFRER
jgi:hypothetical protein